MRPRSRRGGRPRRAGTRHYALDNSGMILALLREANLMIDEDRWFSTRGTRSSASTPTSGYANWTVS